MPVFLHDTNLVDNEFLPAPFAERHLLQGHLKWNWRPWAREVLLQGTTRTMERVFLEWWGWAVTLWSDTRAQQVTGQQLISSLAWVPLAGHLPVIFCLVNSGKMVPKLSPTDVWPHPFFPNGLSLSPLSLLTQVLQAGFCDSKNTSKQQGIP